MILDKIVTEKRKRIELLKEQFTTAHFEKLASEAEVTDSGIVGMDAAKEFFGQFKTLSEADAEWK